MNGILDDGSPVLIQSSPTHVYSLGGSYFVTLVAISNLGCRDSIVHEVIVLDLPQADFTVSDICLVILPVLQMLV
ncbi:MAG: PKD domain-containing protein [Bacteroidetes bacterium]|nr:PKD domain-containing protein [Bacteroidota bacterium]